MVRESLNLRETKILDLPNHTTFGFKVLGTFFASKERVCSTSFSFTINKTAAARTLCTILVPIPL